jgi:DNA topoisomerase-6 subunit B
MSNKQRATETMLLPLGEAEKAMSAVSAEKKKRSAPRETAETMATRQKDISVSEFFAKNRHLLGFDNPRKALLTTVKEAVDNSLDACEEAQILPNITIVIEDLQPNRPANAKQSRYRVTIVDNGPGIVRKQVENVFGRLLFGSKFHRLKMSRGQQGIGISAAGMYGLITTGKPMVIHTRPHPRKPAHHIELAMNTKTNRAEVTVDDETEDFPPRGRLYSLNAGTRDPGFLNGEDYMTGTSVSIELEGLYRKGRGSVDEFLELVAIANPHARLTFVPPSRVVSDDQDDLPLANAAKDAVHADALNENAAHAPADDATAPAGIDPTITTIEKDGVIFFPRGTDQLPPETHEIKPHPRGIELGILIQMMKDFEAGNKRGGTLYTFLQEEFSRVSSAKAGEFCKAAGAHSRTKVSDLEPKQIESLFKAFQEAKLPPPPTDCLAPIGVRQMLAGMLKGVKAEFYAASSREPDVYRGRPFQIEAAIAFGGELPHDDTGRVIRFANRVPLLFQQSACSSFKACTETAWRNYNLSQPRGSLPQGPIVIMIHMASVWVPFTSESKEAIADYDEIRKEMKLALMECGRKLGTYLRKRQKMQREAARRDVFERYIGEISKAINAINGTDTKKLYDALLKEAKKRTAIADAQLDEEGKTVKTDDVEALRKDEGVVLVESRAAHMQEQPSDEAKPSASADGSDEGDRVSLKSKKSKKKKSKKQDELF